MSSFLCGTSLNEFQRRLHAVYLNRWPDAHHIVLEAAVFHENYFELFHPLKRHRKSMDDVPEILKGVCAYGFYMRDPQSSKTLS